jgi:ATP-dependent DNA helicase PIF1
MVEGDLFDKLAHLACTLRKNTKPFGGIQLIVSGDFFQLPPVVKGGQVKFAFEDQKWTECIQRTFNLTKVFRQKDQGGSASVLAETCFDVSRIRKYAE